MAYLLVLIGFAILIKGADIFVEGASSIAKRFHIPEMIIGLTIVAMGTSAPEAAVSITSSLAGQNDMSVANVVGSNFFNILMVLGVSAIIAKLPVQKNTIKKDTPFLLIVSVLLLIFAFDKNISRIEGIIFLVIFVYFLYTTVKSAKNTEESTSLSDNEIAVSDNDIPANIPIKIKSPAENILSSLKGLISNTDTTHPNTVPIIMQFS